MQKPILAFLLGVLIASAAGFVATRAGLVAGLDTEPTQRIEAIARDYILENPEVLVQALRVLQDRRRLADQTRNRATLAAKRDELSADPAAPVGGNPDGNVTIVEFFDYNCPYCKAVYPRLAQLLAEDDQIRLVFKEWPILGPVSELAAKMALALWKQDPDNYQAFHAALLSVRGRLTQDAVFAAARGLGLDVERLKSEMESPEIAADLARNKALAGSLGITGTPAFVVGDRLVPGAASLAQMKALVERARNGG